ncbi:MAG: tRNA epoxyqueuosine(34) reductase QueG, partial [Candidatus Omnitrophica bacterium]|nr:tRNA epoxyqueuosine(34) reductase QueG [Candidatus Omnitrophota bacterium]
EQLIWRLKVLVGKDFLAKSCIDTRPIPERFSALQAGLGFIGRHTNLIHPRFGPYIFLSEILTDLDLKADRPVSGDCASCEDCLHVCPTQALSRKDPMDARRCIAYLTIEHAGVIEREFRRKIGDRIFGCDACLAICPFAAKSVQTAWKEFYPSQGTGEWLDIHGIFELQSDSEFKKRFKGSPISRLGLKRLKRNACLVLANSGDTNAIPYLEKALHDPSPLVRIHAAWGLGQFQSDRSRQILIQRLSQEKDPRVRDEISVSISSS